MSKKLYVFFSVLFLIASLLSSKAQINNYTNPEEILIYEYQEPFFEIPFYTDTLKTGDSTFLFSQNTPETRCYYFNYGPLRCHFFAEPGKEYEISLPDLSRIDEGWKKDQYFTLLPHHVEVNISSTGQNGFNLNKGIRQFDAEFDPFLSKQSLRYFKPRYARAKLDSFIRENYTTDTLESEYLHQYKRYKKAILYYHLKQQNYDTLINNYLSGEAVRFELPPYRIFFSLILDNYFDYLRRKDQFERIYSEFTRLSTNYLREYLNNDPLLKNDTILELVLLKECYNAFYSDRMDKKRLIEFTDSLQQNTEIDIIGVTAKELIKKFTYLRPGFAAPEFSAKDTKGDSIVLSGKHDKLIYIGFCDLNSIQCLQEIEYLKYLSKKHGKFIRILTVLKSPEKSQLQKLSEAANENWSIISWKEHEEIPELFDVKALPVFYLIDKNGEMLRSPAPNPSENFEYKLFEILRSKGLV